MKQIVKIFLLLATLIISLYADASQVRLKSFTNFLESISSKSEISKVVLVNKYFNNYKYIADKTNYKKTDYWASRNEFIKRGKGDCEDFAIAKYFTLLDLGVPSHKLALTMTKLNNQFHIVLIYKNNQNIYYLDNAVKRIKSKRNDLTVLFTVKNNLTEKFPLSERIASYKWKTVLQKAKRQKDV